MSRVIGCAFCECDIEGMHHDLDCPNHPDNVERPDAAPPPSDAVPQSVYCPKCGCNLMAEGATEPSICFRCSSNYFSTTEGDGT